MYVIRGFVRYAPEARSTFCMSVSNVIRTKQISDFPSQGSTSFITYLLECVCQESASPVLSTQGNGKGNTKFGVSNKIKFFTTADTETLARGTSGEEPHRRTSCAFLLRMRTTPKDIFWVLEH